MERQLRCHFAIAPPRHFIYPAVLLLLVEPRHGYQLVDATLRYGFGPVDRPSIYRALHELERDGLLTSWEECPSAGSARSVYGVTGAGQAILSEWMDVVSALIAALNAMVKRFDAMADEPTFGDI